MKLDILAFGAHPDDVEMSCSGILLNFASRAKKTGVVDLTRGEMGTRGTQETRKKESETASEMLGLSVRHNLEFRDLFFEDSNENITKIVEQIRRFKPDIVLANALEDRHPDHGKAAALVEKAFFCSGLKKYNSHWDGEEQEIWRPKNLYHYIQDRDMEPDVIVDVNDHWERRMASVAAYKSQFYDPKKQGDETYISSEKFWKFFEGRARSYGHRIGVEFGEGLIQKRKIGVSNLDDLV